MIRLAVIPTLIACLAGAAAAQPLAGTLKTIKETGVIKLGHRDSSVPFSYVGPDRRPAGYSVDLCERIAQAIRRELSLANLRIVWVPVTVDSRIAAVVTGAVDLECGSTTNTLSRQQQVDFSSLTFVDGSGLLVGAATGISGVDQLTGKRVAVIPGTTTEPALRAALGKLSVAAAVVEVKDHAEGLAALEAGRVEAYASDRAILAGLYTSAKDPQKFALTDVLMSIEPYGFMLRRGDPDFRLAVNRALARIYRTDEIWEVYRRWFGRLGRPGSMLTAMYLLYALPE
jgi:glutamate/aspartate transport system substrate-binding protein